MRSSSVPARAANNSSQTDGSASPGLRSSDEPKVRSNSRQAVLGNTEVAALRTVGFQAVKSSDGRYRLVIALEVPGVPNWLDPAGHAEGVIIYRYQNAPAENPVPVARVVPIAKAVGATVVIVNGSETEMDGLADAILRGPIGEILPAEQSSCYPCRRSILLPL